MFVSVDRLKRAERKLRLLQKSISATISYYYDLHWKIKEKADNLEARRHSIERQQIQSKKSKGNPAPRKKDLLNEFENAIK